VQAIIERGQRIWAWGKGLPLWVLDAVLATCFLIFGLVGITQAPDSGARVYEPIDWRAYLLALAVTLPYYVRRRYPLTVFTVSTVAIVVYSVIGFYEAGLPTVVLVGMYTVGAYCPPRRIRIGFVVMMTALTIILATNTEEFGPTGYAANLAFFNVALLFGWTVQSRRIRLAEAEERAEMLEREQEEERARAVADERLHIAQELHDVVAHSMSVIAVQAGVGMHVADTDAAEAKRALENISMTSRATLAELRRLLGVLRDDGTGAAYAPAPGLGDLDKLAREVSDAGVPVDVQVEGSIRDVPPGIDFTGYRIVQEALTNVLKHAGPSTACVAVQHRPGALRIEVRDDGRGVNGRSTGTGHGLLGMRERVAVYGGTLDAGPLSGGGYRVTALLPYADETGA
jgi:signal transduction histidine kinase